MNVNDVVFRQDLYPRFEHDQALIERYANAVEHLPPIIVNQNNILIDGFHRWKAHQLAQVEEVAATIKETESEAEVEVLAYQYNSQHGAQLSSAEKMAFAQKKVSILKVEDIAAILSVSRKTINNWTKSQRDALKEERNRRILEEYLRAWNTQEDVAELIETTRDIVQAVTSKSVEKGRIAKIHKDFEPFIYAIWNAKKADKETKHFGYFLQAFMENLLYYHTKPMAVVYDPFAGSGTTVDICKKWHRRYYCTDRIVKPGRENDIRLLDIADGLPADLPKPDLAFLDPPYWKQAEGQYSKDAEDLGNMELTDFYNSMRSLLQDLRMKQAERIAIVIQPTQYKNDLVFEDHIFEFNKFLCAAYDIEMRYILPYSTEQYTPQCVEKAKDRGVCLGLHRDLVVWKRKAKVTV